MANRWRVQWILARSERGPHQTPSVPHMAVQGWRRTSTDDRRPASPPETFGEPVSLTSTGRVIHMESGGRRRAHRTGQPTGSIVARKSDRAARRSRMGARHHAATLPRIAGSPDPTGQRPSARTVLSLRRATDRPHASSTSVHRRSRVAGIFGDLLPDFHRFTFRVVLPEATSIPPGYASRELSQALEPFERPNRVQIVQGVYQRWQAIAALTESPESNALDSLSLRDGQSQDDRCHIHSEGGAAVVKSLTWRPVWERQCIPRSRVEIPL